MILCVGEILADMIGQNNGTALLYDRKAGGAPFNVACGVSKFGTAGVFVGSVGDDLIGKYLVDFARSNVGEVHINIDPDHNTTLAFVQIDEHGERSFCFYRKDTADIYLPVVTDELLNRSDIVHIGSLMLSKDCGVAYASSLAKRAHIAGKIVSFDVNYREDIFPNKEKAVGLYKKMLELADIIKLSEEEYITFGKEYVSKVLHEKLVCVTLGENGCEWHYRGDSNRLPTLPLKLVDTTGAGDAFYSGVLAKLDGIPPEAWGKELFDEVFGFANVCGALTTQARGAIDALPTLEEIQLALIS